MWFAVDLIVWRVYVVNFTLVNNTTSENLDVRVDHFLNKTT